MLTDYAHKYYEGNQHGIKNSFRLDDRNIRNDICILINYVVSSPESHNYFIYRDSSKNNVIDCSNTNINEETKNDPK